MSDVVAWLEAELARVGQLAQAAAEPDGPAWTHNPGDCWLVEGQDGPVIYDEGIPTAGQAEHIAAWDPEAVLRRVAADRQILAEHANDGAGDCTVCARKSDERNGLGYAFHEAFLWPCWTVRLLAEGYGWTEDES